MYNKRLFIFGVAKPPNNLVLHLGVLYTFLYRPFSPSATKVVYNPPPSATNGENGTPQARFYRLDRLFSIANRDDVQRVIRMAPPELIKVGNLRIEVLNYTNAREWIWKVTAHLKGEDVWTPIEQVLEERKTRKSEKGVASATRSATAAAAESPEPERSSLEHAELTGKWKDKPTEKEWQKANYKAISILLSIISRSDQQAVETSNMQVIYGHTSPRNIPKPVIQLSLPRSRIILGGKRMKLSRSRKLLEKSNT